MASREYMDLLVVEVLKFDRRLLAQAPWLSHVEVGSKVLFKFGEYDVHGDVVAKIDIRKDDEKIDFLKKLMDICDGKDIPKITKVIKEVEVEYDE